MDNSTIVMALIIIKFMLLAGIFLILIYMALIMFSFRKILPFVPTPKKIIKKMVELAEIKKGDKICDLGSGTGRIIFQAARKNKENRLVGYENSVLLRGFSKIVLFFRPYLRKRVQFINQDIFNLDIIDYNVVFGFLTPAAIRIITPKFKVMPSGSRLVFYMFPLEDHEGFEEKIIHITSKDSIYWYKKI